MADVKVKIQLQDTVEDTIDKIRVDSASNVQKLDDEFVNNVSIFHPPKLDMSISSNIEISKFVPLSTKNNGVNLKSWATGKLSLADGYVGGANTSLSSWRGYNGYVFGAVPENKQFELTLAFFGANIDSLIIYGDKTANQFPTKAYLDSNSSDFIYSNDPIWAIKFDNPSDTHTITFLEWNRGNYNACITYVAVLKNELELGGTYIKNIETLSQKTDRPNELFYGVIPNSGIVELLDVNGELADYVADGIIENSNLEVKVFVKGNEIQNHFTTDTEYQNNTNVLSIAMSNKLNLLDGNIYNGRLFGKDSAHYLPITNLYELLEDTLLNWGYTSEQIDKMTQKVIVCGNDNIERTVRQYLESIKSNYLYLNSATFRETLEKFCSVAQLQVLENENGELEFANARPIATKEELENIILIPKKNQMTYLEKSLIKKNKYTGGKISCNAINLKREISSFNKVMYETIPSENTDLLQDTDGNRIGAYKLADYNGIDALWGFNPEIEGSNIELVSLVNDPNDKYVLGLYKYTTNETHNFYGISITGTVTKLSNIIISSLLPNTNRLIFPLDTVNIKEVSTFAFNRAAFDTGFDYGANQKPNKIHNLVFDNDRWYIFYYDGIVVYNVYEEDGSITPYFVLPIRYIDLSSEITTKNSNYGVVATKYDLNIYSRIAEEKFSTYEIGTNEIPFELSDNNELLQNYTYYNEQQIAQVIGECILSDYRKGISNANISVNCLDYYNLYGEKVIDWNKGQIINVGDIVKFDGDNSLWRVTGRNFRKQGVPLVDLELQEIKQ